jgi:hypothetical protein
VVLLHDDSERLISVAPTNRKELNRGEEGSTSSTEGSITNRKELHTCGAAPTTSSSSLSVCYMVSTYFVCSSSLEATAL